MLSVLSDVYEELKGLLAAGVVGGFGFVYQTLKKERKNYEYMADGVRALLQDRLFQTCNHYIFNQGFVEIKDLNNIENLYQNYHDLGGNGAGTELYERCKHLPLVDAEKASELLEQKNNERVAKSLEALREQENKEQNKFRG